MSLHELARYTVSGRALADGMGRVELKDYSTKELVNELLTREGISGQYAKPHTDKTITVNGPAIVLVVTD